MKFGLKLKLSLIFFIFISIPMAVLGALSYMQSAGALQNQIEDKLRMQTKETADSINMTIDSVEKYLSVASFNEDLANAALHLDEAASVRAHDFISAMKSQDDKLIESMIVTDTAGRAVMTNDSLTPDMDLSDRDYVKSALKGEAAVSEVISSKVTGNPVIAVALPLMQDTRVVGLVVGTINFENISVHSAEVKIGQNGYSYMIDRTGLFVYHPKSEKVLKENLGDTDSQELKAIIEKMKAGETSEGFYTYEGVRKFVRFQPAGNWIVVVTADYNEYMAPARDILVNTIIIALISIIIALILAYIFSSRSIINPIKKLQKLMKLAGEGDLSVNSDIKTKDELQSLSESFNQMINHQSGIVKQVRAGSQELAAASEEMAASAEQISSAAQQIGASIQEVSSNAEKQNDSVVTASQVLVQLASLVQLAQNKARSARSNSTGTMDAAKFGREKVEETVKAMEMINSSANDTAEVVKALNDLSIKVEGIITTINEIAGQTNLLALNAAIEAARAGEHGRGFTVVADEVRKLSEQTNSGANEISNLVNEMIHQTETAVSSMDKGKAAVENGVKIVNETDSSFVDIINAVKQISSDIEEIVDITKDEVATSDQVVKLIDTIATLTETTSANSQEVSASTEEQTATIETMASTAEETSSMAVTLEELVRKFKVGGDEI